MTLIAKTLFGEIHIALSEPDSEGKRGGGITRCDFRDNSPAVNAVENMILAHACAGVDIENDAYLEGVNTTLEGIDNWDESTAENPNRPEPDHTVIGAGTHEIDAEIKFAFSYTESLDERLEDEPMSVEEIREWVYEDIVEDAIHGCLKNLRENLTVTVKPIHKPEAG